MFVILFFYLTSLSQRDGSTTPLPPPTMVLSNAYALPTQFSIGITPEGGMFPIQVNVVVKNHKFECAFDNLTLCGDYTHQQVVDAVQWVQDRLMDGTIGVPSLIPFDAVEAEQCHEFY